MWHAVCMRNLKIDVRQEQRVLPLNCGKQPKSHSWLHVCICKCENQHSASCFEHCCFFGLNRNTEDSVYLEFVKYQLGRHRIVQVFAKCNVCVSISSSFMYRHIKAFFLYRNNSYIFPILRLAKKVVLEPALYRTSQNDKRPEANTTQRAYNVETMPIRWLINVLMLN